MSVPTRLLFIFVGGIIILKNKNLKNTPCRVGSLCPTASDIKINGQARRPAPTTNYINFVIKLRRRPYILHFAFYIHLYKFQFINESSFQGGSYEKNTIINHSCTFNSDSSCFLTFFTTSYIGGNDNAVYK